jgi:hypothetical protein
MFATEIPFPITAQSKETNASISNTWNKAESSWANHIYTGCYLTILLSMGCHLEKESDVIAFCIGQKHCGDKRTQICPSDFEEA